MKKVAQVASSALAIFLASILAAIGQEVRDVTALQRYPWNDLVDITYRLDGVEEEDGLFIQIRAVDRTTGLRIDSLSLDGKPPVSNGKQRVTWDPRRDGITRANLSDLVFDVSLCRLPLYLVVDLSAGPNASSYPFSGLDAIPAGGWTEEHKTTKLVLRRISAGSFSMGSPEGELGREEGDVETQREVTLTRDYYIGVFEVTQKQWELVKGPWISSYAQATRPVDLMCNDLIRGHGAGAQWPATSAVTPDSFIGRLRARTGLEVMDLPTEAQWEYACRAGTTSALNSGKELTSADGPCANLGELGRYFENLGDGKGGFPDAHTAVGSYLPNAWGLYDMHGNVAECCLDWYGPAGGDAIDPKGPATGELRAIRGGHWEAFAMECRSASRWKDYPASGMFYYGFRLAANPAVQPPHDPSLAPASGEEESPVRAYTLLSKASSASTRLAIEPLPRHAQPGEQLPLAYSSLWDGQSETGEVSIAINGETVFAGSGEGAFPWQAPSTPCRLLMTHTDGADVLDAEIIVPGELVLTVDSPAESGYPAPGAHRFELGSVVTSTVPEMVQISETERKVCIGWTGTGSVPAAGEGTNVVFTLYEESTLQWNWDTYFKIQVSAQGEGTVSPTSGWYRASDPVTLTASAIGENRLERWTGDVEGLTATAPSLTFKPDRARTIVAEFVVDSFLRDIVVRSRYPWQRLIDIDYSIGSLSDPEAYELRIVAEDLDTGRTIPVNALDRAPPLTRGTHRVTWDPVRDGAVFTSERMVFHVSLYKVPLYQVVDLTAAAPEDARVSYLDAIPGGAWGDEYKTDKLVLRRIRGGEFMMGTQANERSMDPSMERQHPVRLTKSYYIGVFEVTQRQYQWITGNSPALNPGEKRPVENVSLEDIRGAIDQYLDPRSPRVAPGSFLGKLRLMSGIQSFDLPSEARWEYACRAGTESAFHNGGSYWEDTIYVFSVIEDVARYWDTQNDGKCEYPVNTNRTAGVGCYLPNAWGLYDMHGNVNEWCLDLYRPYSDEGVDPVGLNGGIYSSGSNRITRGGHCQGFAVDCRNAARNCKEPGGRDAYHGFRVISDSVSDSTPCVLTASSSASAVTVDSREVHTVLAGATVDIAYSDRWFPGPSSMQIPKGSAEIAVEGEGVRGWTAPSIPGTQQLTFTHGGDGGAQTITATFQVVEPLSAVVRSRYPWSPLVDIEYTVAGVDTPFDYTLSIEAEDLRTGKRYPVQALDPAPSLENGTHRVVWNPAADSVTVPADQMVFHLSLSRKPLYVVIDLEKDGPDAITGLEEIPAGGWSQEYKTTKMVFRKILPGEFDMGEGEEVRHVHMTKTYYMAVFEMTQRQWELIKGEGENPAVYKGPTRPMENISYDQIRGQNEGAKWPSSATVDADSLIGIFRNKTGLDTIDLPTGAQWEYACRAGTRTGLNNGTDPSSWGSDPNMNPIARYNGNNTTLVGGYSDGHHTEVGSYQPNAWGLYDMHGNVTEWVRDWHSNVTVGNTDPEGPQTGDSRELRGGGWHLASYGCVSASRYASVPSKHCDADGFRLSIDQVPGQPWRFMATEKLSVSPDLSSLEVPYGTEIPISYSDRWDGTPGGEITIEVRDGETLFAGSGEGTLRWRPSRPGTFTLLYREGGTTCERAITVTSGTMEPLSAVVRSRYPWSHLVDIEYTVEGGAAPADYALIIEAEDLQTGKRYPVQTLDPAPSLENGTHRVVWDPVADSVTVPTDQMVFHLSLACRPLYVAIDLEKEGPGALTGLAEVPAGGWSREYKTTKMVFRRILPGEFDMGGAPGMPGTRENEVQRHVRMTKTYYMGVFEVTQRQWELVTGGSENPAVFKGPTRPVENAPYELFRGANKGGEWPSSDAVDADSFIGIFRNKTALDTIDLPTGAQWEYACRAGTDTALNNGSYPSGTGNDPNMNPIARYRGNNRSDVGGYSGAHTEVGSYQPNAWGLYDMHGNVSEYVRDWYGDNDTGDTDPVGPASGEHRVIRGGGWHLSSSGCTSTILYKALPEQHGNADGFRLVLGADEVPRELDRFMTTGTVTVTPDLSSLEVPYGTEIPISYSDSWDGTPGGEITISVRNGATLFTGAGEGIFRWTPPRPGPLVLLHRDGETLLEARLCVTGTVPETVTTPVPVPYDWLDQTGLVQNGDYETAALADGANGRPVWESYVLGLDPTDPASRFVALIEMVDGKAKVTWLPDLGEERTYTIEGKESLSDPDWGPRLENHRFFRVTVEMK